MAKIGGYTIENLYQGGYSSLKPAYNENFSGFKMSAKEVGRALNPTTANQLQEINRAISEGLVPIEFGTINQDLLETIPKEHFNEIRRLAKLTGAKMSFHAPVQGVEPSGIAASGSGERGWSEENRQRVERQLLAAMEKAAMVDKKIPVTIHSANIPGTEWKMVTENGKRVKKEEKMVIINRESGEIVTLKEEEKYYPGRDLSKPEVLSVKRELDAANHTQWDNSLSQIEFSRENATRIMRDTHPLFRAKYAEAKLSQMTGKESSIKINSQEEQEELRKLDSAYEYVKQAELGLQSAFNKAFKYGSSEEQEALKKISENYSKMLGFQDEKKFDLSYFDPKTKADAIHYITQELKQFQPELYKPLTDFAQEKSSETFANVALASYKKFGKDSPIMGIENLYPGFAFSMGDEMAKLIDTSREKFVKKAVANGMSESEAKKAAKEIIGVTFDVGHLNLAKKHGFEDKDLVKEASQLAPYVKHIHLTDNFGHSDSHLPTGMGNVPTKALLEELEKQGDISGMRKIMEIGGFAQAFGRSPTTEIYEAFGAPFSSSGVGGYWGGQAALQQGYFGGYGEFLPQTNYETFGGGFSMLPSELGGMRRSGGARMGGGAI